MRWRDVRFEKPTEADADENGEILQKLNPGAGFVSDHWTDLSVCVAWMPLSELPKFDRIPNPPEGWRFVDKEKEKPCEAKYWDKHKIEWIPRRSPKDDWMKYDAYIVPIDPPKPEPIPERAKRRSLKVIIGESEVLFREVLPEDEVSE